MGDDMLQRDHKSPEDIADRVARLERDQIQIVKRLDTYAELYAKVDKALDKLDAVISSFKEISALKEKAVSDRIESLEESTEKDIKALADTLKTFMTRVETSDTSNKAFFRSIQLMILGVACSSTIGFLVTLFWKTTSIGNGS